MKQIRLGKRIRNDSVVWGILDIIAEREERSKVGVIRLALREYCEQHHTDLVKQLRPVDKGDRQTRDK